MTTPWADLHPATIAVSGDWHADQHFAQKAITFAKNSGAQTILHVGDFGYTFRRQFLDDVQYALQRAGLMLGFVDGNHDNHDLLGRLVDEHGVEPIPMRSGVFYLPRTYRWEWSGVRFLALGGAASVDRKWRTPGSEWWPDETISWQQAQKAGDDGPAEVMVCHDVPAGVSMPWIENNPFGFPESDLYRAEQHRQLLREVVDQVTPKLLFAGHYHERHSAELTGEDYRTVVEILDMNRNPVGKNTMIVDLTEMLRE